MCNRSASLIYSSRRPTDCVSEWDHAIPLFTDVLHQEHPYACVLKGRLPVVLAGLAVHIRRFCLQLYTLPMVLHHVL